MDNVKVWLLMKYQILLGSLSLSLSLKETYASKEHILHLLICESWQLFQPTLKFRHKIRIHSPSFALDILKHLLFLS